MSRLDEIYEKAQLAEIEGYTDPVQEKNALDLYRKAAEKGHFLSQWHLAEYLHLFGEGKRDESECTKWYEACALRHKYPRAFYHAGVRYCFGSGVRVSIRKGIEYLTYAAEKGIGEAIVWLGRHYTVYRRSKKLRKKGFDLLCRVDTERLTYLYDDNTPGELYSLLGDCYKEGRGTKVNPEKAFECYKKSANMGDLGGQVELGRCYKDGFGVGQDGKKAVELFRESSEYHGDAQYMLGMCYLDGIGVEKDEKEGVRWLQMAVDDGWGEPMYHLALCYIDGRGVKKDREKGLDLMRRAFDEGAILDAYLYLNKIFPDEYPLNE